MVVELYPKSIMVQSLGLNHIERARFRVGRNIMLCAGSRSNFSREACKQSFSLWVASKAKDDRPW